MWKTLSLGLLFIGKKQRFIYIIEVGYKEIKRKRFVGDSDEWGVKRV